MNSLHEIARILGGQVVIGGQVLAPGPNRGPRDRSLSVTVSAFSPDGWLALSRCGDDMRVCRDYVRARLAAVLL